jgi:cytochrome oxidase assembly protein ShyY1
VGDTTTPPAAEAPAPPGPGGPDPRQRLRTAAAALRLFRERGWAAALLGVVLLAVVFCFLGRWQYHRHEARQERADLVRANYDAAPVPLAELLPGVATDPGVPLAADLQWRPARVTGTYRAADTVVVRNRPLDGRTGYEVVVPFVMDDGTALLVDRGWVPAGATGDAPAAVPAPPPGRVEAVVRLRPGEPGLDRRPPPGQALRIDIPQIGGRLGSTPVVGGAYGVLATESPAPAESPVALPRPDPGIDINLPYAMQWYAFALVAFVLLGVGAVKEVHRRDPHRVAPEQSWWRRRFSRPPDPDDPDEL